MGEADSSVLPYCLFPGPQILVSFRYKTLGFNDFVFNLIPVHGIVTNNCLAKKPNAY